MATTPAHWRTDAAAVDLRLVPAKSLLLLLLLVGLSRLLLAHLL
jgi:hypothetical protein